MKNILKSLLLVLILNSCSGEIDTTVNPNTPNEVDKKFMLTAAEASLATTSGGALGNLGGFLAQYHTQSPSASQYLDIDTYNMNTDFANRLWTELYAGCLNDLQRVKSESISDGETGSTLIATALEVYTFQILTDVFGDIPYFEAFQAPNNITPMVDSQRDIYLDLIAKLNAAITLYTNNPVDTTMDSNDVVYGGDMTEWTRFANTLLLKLHLRLAYTADANPVAVQALLTQDNFLTSDALFNAYSGAIDGSNPFYDVQIDRLGDVNNVGSASLVEFYASNADPRLNATFRPTAASLFTSLDQGNRGAFPSNQATDYSRPNVLATTPVYFMTVAESNFLQAEALIRYSAGTGAAAKYNAGVMNSFLTYGLDPAGATTLTNAGGTYEYVVDANVETALRQVIVQKWAALAYVNNIEAFIETNRTQFPETVAFGSENYATGNFVASIGSVLGGTETPNSLFYPDNEVTRNPNVTQKTSLIEKVWWDQK